ncbi:DUF3858 domain-containing protein [Flaviaesturariibacter amylovorans]|uniref:DUF3857 domain-containing protein n=1 Tax=Flaviaesturariibacter amylovorans TaxID=1084520 RepID=A0ABP8GGQ2_9BACT
MRKYILPLLCAALSLSASAQKRAEAYKFEKITPEMLERRAYPIDSNAHAVILADVGSTEIEGNTKGWFSFLFRRHKRVHILDKNGYDEATFRIVLDHSGFETEERVENLKAVAYNLENGKVVETRLSKENIFNEKESDYRNIKKFTLPNVKEGTIIDVEYRVHSDYISLLQPWSFQDLIPCLWSDYTVSIPEFFDYNKIYKGYTPFYISDKKERTGQFNITEPNATGPSERFSLQANIIDHRWVAKDVPAFRTEPFLSTPGNYISHIDFQLSAMRAPLQYRNLVPSWGGMTRALLNSEAFGKKLDANNGWLKDVMTPLMKGTPTEQARNIYNYVRDHVTCTGGQGVFLSQPVKNVFKNGTGNVADVNLLLVTMLRYANIQADPVMLSTLEHGKVFTIYPLLTRFNYVIASCSTDAGTFYLDASKPRLGFGRLQYNCYNGMARTINNTADPVMLVSDSLRERRFTSVFLTMDDKKKWVGTKTRTAGYYESSDLRRLHQEKGKDAVFADLRKDIGGQVLASGFSIDSLDQYEHPVTVRHQLGMEYEGEPVLYIDPMFGEGIKENPFKSAERLFPVEMPYTLNQTYSLTIYIPDGYEVDELPKSMRLHFNEAKEGGFEYLISQSEGVISMRSVIRLDRTVFTPEEYENLREFYTMIVAKQKEQIVLKKKK